MFLQPIRDGRNIGTCMSVDLQTGLIDTGRVAPAVSNNRTIFGLVGLARLQKGCALVAVTGAEQVCEHTLLVAALKAIVYVFKAYGDLKAVSRWPYCVVHQCSS